MDSHLPNIMSLALPDGVGKGSLVYDTVLDREFLNPRCSVATLDTFLVRRSIVGALRAHLRYLKGTLLDIGCGRMPYKRILTSPPSQVKTYVGLDLANDSYGKPHLTWDGRTIPLQDDTVDCAIATELFEHCPDPEMIMRESLRALKPGGMLFFTIPFLWPLHDVPCDEYRYTPFSIERHLRNAGFGLIQIRALGGWDASMAQLIGLWARRRPMSRTRRAIASSLVLPVVLYLASHDRAPESFGEGAMITGLAGTARKPLR